MKSSELLRRHWQARRARDKRFSLRYFARRLDVSATYLSKILSGKKPLPLARARALAAALELDPVAVRALERALLRERSRLEDTQENLTLDVHEAAEPLAALPSSEYSAATNNSALEEWYFLPILDLVTCKDFEPTWIHDRLGLRREVADRAWARLRELGWVVMRDGAWAKETARIRFPSHGVDSAIQRHHTTMLRKAADELNHRRLAEDFAQRLVLGASVATNEKSFRRAEKFLEEAVFKASSIMAEGRADRVYYLALQLFPLTQRKPKA